MQHRGHHNISRNDHRVTSERETTNGREGYRKNSRFSHGPSVKGDVAKNFEMHAIEEAGGCWGFPPEFLKAGAELLVYASQLEGEYENEPL